MFIEKRLQNKYNFGDYCWDFMVFIKLEIIKLNLIDISNKNIFSNKSIYID